MNLVGDSTMSQMFHAMNLFTKKDPVLAQTFFPSLHPWRCMARTDDELATLFEGDGSVFFRKNEREKQAPGVLIMNFGLWYDLRCSSERECKFEDPVPDLLAALESQNESKLQVRDSVTVTPAKNLGFDTARDAACSARNHVLGAEPPERAYAKDLIRLARFVERNRQRLPQHVFWLDTIPQYFRGAGTYPFKDYSVNPDWKDGTVTGSSCQNIVNGRLQTWRNSIARRIWKAVSPSTHVVHLQELLLDRLGDHARMHQSAEFDCTYYCQGSSTWNEYVATVLSSIVAHAVVA